MIIMYSQHFVKFNTLVRPVSLDFGNPNPNPLQMVVVNVKDVNWLITDRHLLFPVLEISLLNRVENGFMCLSAKIYACHV